MKKILAVFALCFCFSAVPFAQDNYSYSNAEKDDDFKNFETKVSSYENALVLVVQTFDTQSRQPTNDNVKISITDNNNKKKNVKLSVKTPYLYVIEDYKVFKDKYDFATANEQRAMLDANPDTTYTVKVDANLRGERRINVFIADKKNNLVQQTGISFPFAFAAECKTRYADVINNVDESIDNSGLNDIKDYYTGPKFIKQ